MKIIQCALIPLFLVLFGCNTKNETSVNEEEEIVQTDRVLSLPDSLKEGLYFKVKVSENHDYDDSLFDPSLEIIENTDSTTFIISFIQSGFPAFDGGFELDSNTLSLLLLDKYPDEGYTSEDLYITTFKIPSRELNYKSILLKRIYDNLPDYSTPVIDTLL